MKRCSVLAGALLASFAAVAGGAALFPSDGTAFRARPGTKATLNGLGALEVVCDGTYGWPGVELQPRDGTTWDFSGVGAVEVVVSNMSDRTEVLAVDVFPKSAKNRDAAGFRAKMPSNHTIALESCGIFCHVSDLARVETRRQ